MDAWLQEGTRVVTALLRAGTAERLGSRIFNIGAGQGRSVRDVADAVEAVSGRRLERLFRPARPVDVPSVVLDVSRAREELGWVPATPWEEALERTYRWNLADCEPRQ